MLDRGADGGDGFRLVGSAPHPAADRPGAERDPRDLERCAGNSGPFELHLENIGLLNHRATPIDRALRLRGWPHFRDYHLLLDEQSEQIFATTDDIAERVRKIGGTTLRSIGHIGRLQRVLDNDADFVTPLDMLAELRDDNKQLVASLRETHAVCDEHNDVASASLIENWIDEAERRTWFLFEATRVARE
jgi:DNA-binding ferritin-like protein